MKLSGIYTGRVAAAVAAAASAAALVAAWYAAHPPAAGETPQEQQAQEQQEATDEEIAAASAFLATLGVRAALTAALAGVLTDLWAEGWALGQGSAESAVTGAPPAWRDWVPGDADAAREAASRDLDDFLRKQGTVADDIAGTYTDGLAETLATAARQGQSKADAEAAAGDVLDDEHSAAVISHTEMSRAQFGAAGTVYQDHGITQVDILTADDDRVCPECAALQASNPHDVHWGDVFTLLPVHPFDRCVAVPAEGDGGTPASQPGGSMASLLRRVLSDGYVPVEIGRR